MVKVRKLKWGLLMSLTGVKELWGVIILRVTGSTKLRKIGFLRDLRSLIPLSGGAISSSNFTCILLTSRLSLAEPYMRIADRWP